MQSFRADLDALYLPKRPSQGDLLELPEEEGRHVRTLRLRQGEPVLLLDGAGGRTQATIERIDRRAVVVRAGITVLDEGEGRPYIVLGIGLLADKSRFEWVVEKAVELGVREIHPLVTERSEGRLHAERIGRIARFFPILPGRHRFKRWLDGFGSSIAPVSAMKPLRYTIQWGVFCYLRLIPDEQCF
jgi:RsmE family RNA methyltransferase